MNAFWRKTLSLLLALVLAVGMTPAALAAEMAGPAEEPEEIAEPVPAPAGEEDAALPEEPAAEDGGEVPEEPAAENDAEVPEEPAAAEEPEEEEPAVLPEDPEPLALTAAEALRLEDGEAWLVITAENGAPEALTVRAAPKPAEGEEVAEDAWETETVAPNAAGEYLYNVAPDGREAGTWVVEAFCEGARLEAEFTLAFDPAAEFPAVDGLTLTLPAPAEAAEPAEGAEEAETPEEPEEPAPDAGEPEGEEPADAEEPEDAGTEPDGPGSAILSEPIGARKTLEDNGFYIQNVSYNMDSDGIDGAAYFQSSFDGYVIAESSTTRYYLGTIYGSGTRYFEYVTPLPAGTYTLRLGKIAADGVLTCSAPYAKKMVVLPAPEISLGGPSDSPGYRKASLKLPADMSLISTFFYDSDDPYGPWDYFSANELRDHAVKGVFSWELQEGYDYRYGYKGGIDTGNAFSINSPEASLVIPKYVAPVSLAVWAEKNGTQYGYDPDHPYYLVYKGETVQIITDVYDSEVDDLRLTFKSDNTKAATVDALGRVKAVGNGKAEITVASAAGTVEAYFYVRVDIASPKSFKFDAAKLVDTSLTLGQLDRIWNDPANYSYPHLGLQLITTGLPSGDEGPVTYTVSGGDGLKIYVGSGSDEDTANYENPHVGDTPAGGSLYNNTAQIKLMATEGGVYTVTAEAFGKTATCTVWVDGFSHIRPVMGTPRPDEESSLFIGGKAVTGWVKLEHDGYVFGADALKDLSGDIRYLDPATKRLISDGIHKIGKKAYRFDGLPDLGALYRFPLNNWSQIYFGDSYNPEYVYIGQDAALLTGWQEVDADYNGTYETVRYFDPSTYLMARNTWVPTRGNHADKGLTWVNADGDLKDDDGKTLDGNGAIWEDGFHKINGDWYVFKNGAVLTGWVYLRWISIYELEIATSKTGTLKVYCDPNLNGKVAEDEFRIGSKDYAGTPLPAGIDAGVILPGPFCKATAGKSGVKYLLQLSGGEHVIGPDGSIFKGGLIKAFDTLLSDYVTAYAKADGCAATDEWITVKGKNYYFDSRGGLTTEQVSTEWYVIEDVDYSKVKAQYDSSTGSYTYYTDNTAKLNSVLLYAYYDGELEVRAVLDAKGRPAVNTAVKARPDLNTSDTFTYLAGPDGVPLRGYSYSYHSPVEFKGKLYAVKRSGAVHDQAGYLVLETGGAEGLGVTDKNGVLTRNAFKTIKGTGTVYFNEEGQALRNEYIYVIKGKVYNLTAASYYLANEDVYVDVSVVDKPAKAGWTTGGDPMYINKDGTIKTGFLTNPKTGRKMYFTVWNGYEFRVLDCVNADSQGTVWRIGGKLYCFDNRCQMVTGWIYFGSGVCISDPSTGEALTEERSNRLMYFDPKTGAAAAGGWKTAPLPLLIGSSLYYGAEYVGLADSADRSVNASNKSAKLYFTSEGDLVRSTEMTIGKNTYLFAADGSSSFKTGWTDGNKMYYVLKNGKLATGRQKIDGQYYLFDATGRKVINALRRVGSKWYYFDRNGVQTSPVLSVTLPYSGDRDYFGSPGVDLTAVWNADGSLARIVYTGSGMPAAGVTVNFGSYDDGFGIYSLYLLDSKGLPATGPVTVTWDGGSSTYLYAADGSRMKAGYEDNYSLFPYGKTYYVVDNETVQTSTRVTAMRITGSWRGLSAADQKVLDTYYNTYRGHAYDETSKIWVLKNPDGSVAANQAVRATVDGTTRLWHTDRFGIPMEYYVGVFKFGGKWYVDAEADPDLRYWTEGSDSKWGYFKTKSTGELIGFYDRETNKPLSGVFGVASGTINGIFHLKKGKPVTGDFRFNNWPYYTDAEMGCYPVEWL